MTKAQELLQTWISFKNKFAKFQEISEWIDYLIQVKTSTQPGVKIPFEVANSEVEILKRIYRVYKIAGKPVFERQWEGVPTDQLKV